MKRKLMLASVCALFLGTAVDAVVAELIEGSLTVAAGATNSATEITLNRSGSLEAPAVDRLVVLNASGTGTGTVTFAAMAAGVPVTIGSTNSVRPGPPPPSGRGASMSPGRRPTPSRTPPTRSA